MFRRGLLPAAGLLAGLGCWAAGVAIAQVRIEIPDVDVPERRPDPNTGVNMVDLAGGLFALKDGYDRSRRGYICVLTYYDRNGNGRRDRGEGPLPGWSFTIADAAGSPAARGQTGKEGRFCNDRPLAPGAYSVRQDPGDGWTNTEPGAPTPDLKPVTLPADSSVTVLFGNCRGEGCEKRGPVGPAGPGGPPAPKFTGKICVTKFEDSNGNGVRDGQEWVLPAWTIHVLSASGTLVAIGTTNAQGEFCTAGTLTPGNYTVSEVVSGGWVNTSPGGPSHTLALAQGQTAAWSFGNRRIPPTQICITKFNDLNGDGVKQANEPKLPGWAFTIAGPGGTMPAQNSATSTTVCNTAPFAAGPTTVTETPQPGWSPTTPGGLTQSFNLVPTQNVTLMFGNRQTPVTTGRVCVLKYNDANGNGSRQSNEPFLAGWTFSITTPNGTHSGQTDVNGSWCTANTLAPGTYTVIETPKPGWVSTTPGGATPSISAVVTSGQTTTVGFGNRQAPPASTAQVCVAKYNDLDGDGVRDAGEPGLPGWIFSVKTVGGAMLAFGTTNAQGEWCSTATLPPGAVNVFETAQAGWTSTDPANVATGTAPKKAAALVAGQTTNVVFGNKTARVCVAKFNDLNGNGVKNPGEPLLAGWAFSLQGVTGTVLDSGLTNAQGEWCSTAVLPTGYPVSVVETQQTGWQNTKPGGAHKLSPTPTVILAMTAGQTANLTFGNWTPPSTGKVCVRKFRDLNSDGQEGGTGEPVLPGWTFTITGPSGPITLVTGANGTACTQANLTPGSYTVTETLQAGWTNTAPGNATASKVVAVNPTGTAQVVFGNVPVAPGILCVNKYQDLVRNNRYDAADPMLAGWTFEVRNASGAVVATGVTDAQGRWCSPSPLPAGTYTVTEVQQSGWVVVDPMGPPNASPPYKKTALLSATRGADLFFGNIRSGTACITKYNDLNGNGHRDPGEPPLAGFTFHFQYTGSSHATDVHLTTGPSGEVCLELPPGAQNWVWELPKPGWTKTEGGAGGPGGSIGGHVFAIEEGKTLQLAFGNRQTGTPIYGRICVVKFNDLNGDGVKQAGEPLLPGWAFSIPTPNGTMSSTTDAAGGWCTPQVFPPGTYTVTETLKPGWSATTPGGPSQPAPVTGGLTTTLTFGNRQLAQPAGRVCIAKYNDINQNAVFDPGEATLSGWQFNLKDGTGATIGQAVTGADGRVCSELPNGVYAAYEVNQPGWSNSDPVGPALHKPFTITGGQTVDLVFGNYQPPKLRFRKVVTSTAPAGGFPLTGLVFGNAFQISHQCTLGNQVGGATTPVPANGIAPIAGYTGSSVGAICIITETPPPGLLAWADCPTGQGHWDTPVIASSPHTIAPAMNEITVTNRFVCEKGPPPAPVRLTVQKIKLTSGMCHGALPAQNECLFQITVTNVGGSAYSGPLNFSDTVTGAQATVVTSPGLACPSGPQSGAFACTAPTTTIPAGGSVTFQVKLFLSSAAPAQNNCVTLNYLFGGTAQAATACAQIFP